MHIDRDNRAVQAGHDCLKAGPEFIQLAILGQFAFREDTDHMPLLEFFSGLAQASGHRLFPLIGRNRNGIHQLQDGFEQGDFVKLFEHDKADKALHGGPD